MDMVLAAPFAALFGGILGSFLNVVAYRLPRGESLSHPGSRCPGCSTPIKPYDNVPVLSWLALRGRCRACAMRIPWRYPAVEAATALLCGLVALAHPDAGAVELWLGLVLVLLLVPITLIDLDHQIIPNKLVALGCVAAAALLIAVEPGALTEHAIAALGAGGFFLVAVLAYPSGMGMGDVKLAFMLGLFLGRAVVPAIFVALIVGTVVGGVIMARVGVAKGRKTKIPFGPYLALGGIVGFFAGDALVDWYVDTFFA
jgi:leader peptidase (prepilin peptidase)/N-methyltransferase